VCSQKISKTDYSKIAKYYDKVRSDAAPALLSKIIEYGKIDENSTVLDVGCGTGRFTLSLPAVKNLFCALEPSAEMLRQALAKDKDKTVQWIRGDGQHSPFTGSLFDCVYMTAVVHHLEHKDIALKEVHRVLKAGGTCVIMTFSHGAIKKHILNDFPGVTKIDLNRIPSVPWLKEIMTMIGFKNVHYHVVQLDEGYVSTNEYLERVRKKYISTLTLLTEEEFRSGLRIFEERARNKYGSRIRRISRFVFVVGKK
jgi:ubiquinone/menaquinone biosynthesis C-methylase UbiE